MFVNSSRLVCVKSNFYVKQSVFWLILAFAVGCSKQQHQPQIPTDSCTLGDEVSLIDTQRLINGTWAWFQSSTAKGVITPKSEGYSLTYMFGDTFKILRNDVLQNESPYALGIDLESPVANTIKLTYRDVQLATDVFNRVYINRSGDCLILMSFSSNQITTMNLKKVN